jgi:hypothetical protein
MNAVEKLLVIRSIWLVSELLRRKGALKTKLVQEIDGRTDLRC